MNVEYVGTFENQKLTTKMLFVETFFMKLLFCLHPMSTC